MVRGGESTRQCFTAGVECGIVVGMSTPSAPRRVIRLERRNLLYIGSWGVLFCSAALVLLVMIILSGAATFLGIVLPTATCVVGAWIALRTIRLAVFLDGDVMLVRNYTSSHRIARSQIRGFGVGQIKGGRRLTVMVETGLGPVSLDVLAFRNKGAFMDDPRTVAVREWAAAGAAEPE